MVDRWALGWSRSDWWEALRAPRWISPPSGHFYADPFLLSHAGEPWVFFEDYVDSAQKGHIACCPLQRPEEVEPVLTAPYHLSYPFLIEEGGELFCVPEQQQARRVSLFRCLEFPRRWKEEVVLLPDFPGVDPTLLEWKNRFYLWIGHQEREPRHQVFLFHSPHLSGPWELHTSNPVLKYDWTGRNGGTILNYQGRLLRPAQNRTRTYGGGLVLREIIELSPFSYQERKWGHWEPDPRWPYPDGLHHVCTLDGFTVIDAKLFVEGL